MNNMKKNIFTVWLLLGVVIQSYSINVNEVRAASCPTGYTYLNITTPTTIWEVVWYDDYYAAPIYSWWHPSDAGSINRLAHFVWLSWEKCYKKIWDTGGTQKKIYEWNGTGWVYRSWLNSSMPIYEIISTNMAPTIWSITVPSYINWFNVSSTPFTINGITDTDNWQTLTYYYSWDGSTWTTIWTQASPRNNGSYSFNLNTTSRPQGNNTLRVKVNDGFVDSSIITSVNIVKDTVSPTLTQITAVSTPTNDNTPNYTFSSTEAWSITYGGSCSSVTTSAVSWNNTITFSTLPEGVFSNCTIRVTDTAGNQSSVLNVASFVVDLTAPVSPNSVIINGGVDLFTNNKNINLQINHPNESDVNQWCIVEVNNPGTCTWVSTKPTNYTLKD